MTFRRNLDLPLLVSAVAVSRFLFRSRLLYDLDSVNFALGMRRFAPRVHQPHPPGYFLYVCLGRWLRLGFHDANLALVVLSIAASCGTIFFIYEMALEWFGLSAARFAALLFLFSPLAWFHGTVALTYIVEAFFSSLLGYLCWRSSSGNGRWIWLAGLALGISAGIRQSSLLFLGPLFLFVLWRAKPKDRLLGITILLASVAAWAAPMVWVSGGLRAYLEPLLSLWRMTPSKDTVFNSSPATSIARACTLIPIYFLCFGAASLAPLVPLGRFRAVEPRRKVFTAVWMAPALCFFTFIFLKFVNSGYLLVVLPPACIWLGLWMSEWYRETWLPKPAKATVVWIGAAANVLIFLFSPFYCSYRSVRRFEAQIRAIQRALPLTGSPADTVIVAFDSHFLGFRHAGYYLPGYLSLEYPEAHLLVGTRIFTMQGGETHLLSGLPGGAPSRFVLFPLPAGKIYEQYLQQVLRRLPPASLRTVHAGGFAFVTGPSSDLPLLFPPIAAQPRPGMYMPLHTVARRVNNRAQ